MRPAITILAAALAVLGPGAATATAGAKTDVTFETTMPCAILCPYFALDSDDVDRDAACEPVPDTVPGSFDDIVIDVPATAQFIQLLIEPAIDYDSFLCRTDPDANGSYLIDTGATDPGCPSVGINPVFLPSPVGCGEFMSVFVTAFRGEQIVFRAFNFSDGPTASGSYEIFP